MASRPSERVIRFIGYLGCAAAVLCSPPVAARLLALDRLHSEDIVPLWFFSMLLLGASLLIAFGKFRAREGLAAAIVPLLLLIAVETAARTWVRTVGTRHRELLVLLSRRTYQDQMAYQPHPFLQFTGRPNATVHSQAWGTPIRFNRLGFHDRHLTLQKPANTTRVACLGGSTTASGYPFQLEQLLEDRVGQEHNFQAMNFGLGWYTSTHSAVNFILNAVDYSPDYVVIHHAINEGRGRGRAGGVRNDYTHLCKPFEYPRIRDAYLIRASIIYRYVRQLILGSPSWAFLGSAVEKEGTPAQGDPFVNLSDLKPYERNFRVIVELALARGITPVLTTQPHSTDPATQVNDFTKHFQQCNDLVRRLAAEYRNSHPEQVLLVDLDRTFTGQDDLFVDMVHMTELGVTQKAAAIANVIFDHWRPTGTADEI